MQNTGSYIAFLDVVNVIRNISTVRLYNTNFQPCGMVAVDKQSYTRMGFIFMEFKEIMLKNYKDIIIG